MRVMDWIAQWEDRLYQRHNLSYFFLLLFILGLFTIHSFRALSGVALAGIFLCSISKQSLKGYLYTFWKSKAAVAMTVIFLMHLASVPFTAPDNVPYMLERLSIKLPFLLLPLALVNLPKLSKKRYEGLFFFYFICLTITVVMALINYAQHFEEINQSVLRSKIMPVVVNHVRYSLMVCFGIFCGAWLVYRKFVLRYPWERWVIAGLTLLLFVFLHILTVRSGLIAFYFVLFITILYYAVRTKRIVIAGMILVGVLTVPVVAYFAMPTLQNKVKNSLTDLGHFDDQYNANFYSMTGRVFSYKVGWALFKKEPVLGVGIGNLKRETNLQYIRDYGLIQKRILPHNQYLRYLTAFGAVGFVIFLVAFYYPLFEAQRFRKDYMLFLQYVVVSVSFLFEGTLETQLGNNLSLIFILIPLYNAVSTQQVPSLNAEQKLQAAVS